MRGGDRGASAVEFALIVSLLLAVLFAVVDYGLFMFGRTRVEHAVQDAVRWGTVAANEPRAGCSAGTVPQRMACTAKARVPGGRFRVSATGADGTAGVWERGGTLTVCGMTRSDGVTGFTPMPGGGLLTATAVIRIERDLDPDPATYADPALSGTDWTWCA